MFKGKLSRIITGIDLFPNKNNEFSIDWEYTNDYHKFLNVSEYSGSSEQDNFSYLRNSQHFHSINTVNANFLHRFAEDNHTFEIDYNLNIIDNTLQFLGTDYTLPLSEKGVFEAGTTWNKRVLKSNYTFSTIQAETIDSFDYEENVFAGYVQLRWEFSKLKIQTGLRYEYFESSSESTQVPTHTTKDFSNLFPSLHLSYEINDSQQLSLGHS